MNTVLMRRRCCFVSSPRHSLRNILSPLFAPVVFILSLVLSPGVSLPEILPAGGGEKKADDRLHFGFVKLGLDALMRGEGAANFSLGRFSFASGNDEGRVLFRLRPSVTVSPSESLTARVEGQWYAFYDDRDFSEFTLYQGFVEGTIPGAKKVSLKAGRQEFVYGSGFLLGNDAFYDGLSFDAVKASLKPANGFSSTSSADNM